MSDFSDLDLGFKKKLKLIRQTQTTECGIACLAMLASYYGAGVGLTDCRRFLKPSDRGANLEQLIKHAKMLGFDADPLRVDLDDLDHLLLPCVLHWDFQHFVILESLVRGEATIYDPAEGIRRMPLSAVSTHFTGVVLEVRPNQNFQVVARPVGIGLRRTLGRLDGVGRAVGYLIILALILEGCAILWPFLLQWTVDNVLAGNDRYLLISLLVGYTLLAVLTPLIESARSWATLYFGTHFHVQWVSNIFSHLLRLPVQYFERRSLGDLMSRFESVEIIQRTITNSVITSVIDGLFSIILIIVMWYYSKLMTLIVASGLIALLCVRSATFHRSRTSSADYIMSASKQAAHFLESMRGIQALKLGGREEQRRKVWRNLMVRTRNDQASLERTAIVTRAVCSAIGNLQAVALVGVGAFAVMKGGMSIGMLVAFIAYKDQFNARVSPLLDHAVEIKMLGPHVERIADIICETPEKANRVSASSHFDGPCTVDLKDVAFRYSDTDPWLLRTLTLSVAPGECVAIVGRSGVGKSTIIKLVAGLLNPTSGVVLLDGDDTKLHGTRHDHGVAVVMQDDVLFAGSISDNIAFFDDCPDMEHVHNCARLACIHEDVRGLPMGYNTLIGDMGSTLSGGQKQRVLLARALYQRPRLLLLDEATSHLDTDTDAQMALNLGNLEMTRIMIAHRPETIKVASRVFRLTADGVLREAGRSFPSVVTGTVTASQLDVAAAISRRV